MNTNEGRFQHAAYYGVLNIFAYVILNLIIHYANLPQQVGWISFATYALITILGIRSWVGKQGELGSKFGQTFLYTTLVTLVFVIGCAIWAFIYSKYIGQARIEEQMVLQAQKLEEKGMDPTQIETTMAMARKFTTPLAITLFTLFGGMFFYSIINLILAAVFKREPKMGSSPFGNLHLPPNFPQNQDPTDFQSR
jgi:hypothetical protein